jgi:hypothetical protein
MSKSLTGAGRYGGTVSSIKITVPPFLQVTPGPITTSGTFVITTTVPPTGSGALVLANSPTLITPNIGAATGTSLTVTGRISTTSSGIAARFGASPAGSGSPTNIIIQNSSTSALELCLASNPNDYSIGASAGDSVIRAIGSTNRLFLQTGGAPAMIINSDNTLKVGSLTSCVVLSDSNSVLTPLGYGAENQVLTMVSGAPAWRIYTPPSPSFSQSWFSMLGGGAPWPSGGASYSDGYQPTTNWVQVDNFGENLTYLASLTLGVSVFTYNGVFRNLLGRTIYAHVYFSAQRDFGSEASYRLSTYEVGPEGSPAIKTVFQTQQVVGPTYACISGLVRIKNFGWLAVEGRQTTGLGNNFVDGNLQFQILY